MPLLHMHQRRARGGGGVVGKKGGVRAARVYVQPSARAGPSNRTLLHTTAARRALRGTTHMMLT